MHKQWCTQRFWVIPFISKITCFSVTSSPSPCWGPRSVKFLNYILLHCWKRHLRHFAVILSSCTFVFLLICLGAPELQCQYQHPPRYITDNVNLKISDILFNNSVMNKWFQKKMENANIILFYKKGDKQIIKNYQPVSLLPPCSKIFEKKTIFLSLNI